MRVLIGMDEAGYGPNLGPLVISASVWRVSRRVAVTRLATADLYELLADAVVARNDGSGRLVLCDSKQLYQPGGGLGNLECSLLSCLGWLGNLPMSWRALWESLVTDQLEQVDCCEWYASYDEPLPVNTDHARIAGQQAELAKAGLKSGVRLSAVRSLVLTEPYFNQRLLECGNKSTLLSESTLRLLAETVMNVPEEQISVRCDKHGGRARYAAVLQHIFSDMHVEVLRESRESSEYRMWGSGREIEICFSARGESFMPTALASIASKYVRELAMRAYNAYWTRLQPGLRPTAGYPVDAKRFYREIAELRSKLTFADERLWRAR